jgi:uncharacterized lipoprotein YmbA
MRLAACLLVASFLASACSVRSPAADYWTLAALTPAPAAWDEAGPAVAIGPVALPRHLDRPQVLVRHDSARVEPAGLHRWADPLDDGLGRVLAANLGRSLGSRRVSAYPVQPPYALDYRVHLDVERFDGRPGDALVLSARWVITGSAGGEALAVERSDIEVPAGESFASFIGAHSLAAAELAAQIDTRLRRLSGD